MSRSCYSRRQPTTRSCCTAADEEEPARRPARRELCRQGRQRPSCKNPAWSKTMLIWLYDEHGGYYYHVPPPAAIPPDAIPHAYWPRRLSQAGSTCTARAYRPSSSARGHSPTPLTTGTPPHLRPRHHRSAVEPAGAYLPRRQRHNPGRLHRSTTLPTFATPPTLAAPSDPKPGLQQILAHGQLPPPPPAG